jgi:hypothetical protein
MSFLPSSSHKMFVPFNAKTTIFNYEMASTLVWFVPPSFDGEWTSWMDLDWVLRSLTCRWSAHPEPHSHIDWPVHRGDTLGSNGPCQLLTNWRSYTLWRRAIWRWETQCQLVSCGPSSVESAAPGEPWSDFVDIAKSKWIFLDSRHSLYLCLQITNIFLNR